MKYDTSWISNPGGQMVNEDACAYHLVPTGGSWVVADGLGGHRGGQKASSLAVETALAFLSMSSDNPLNNLHDTLENAQKAIIAGQQAEPDCYAMRTTIILLVIRNDQARWAHLGDSRLYVFHKNRVIFQTKDHSVPQMLVGADEIRPEDIRGHKDRNRLLRCLGSPEVFRPAIYDKTYAVQPGDSFLLCTDGFWEYVLEKEMEEFLGHSASVGQWLKKMEELLSNRTHGNHDSYTAIGIRTISVDDMIS
ncbi:PP2C family protein-serine/threonine phosphatase [Desulfatirhabdium butyrativorans]|uniref:PP2C family protein-serine/threonine phosphatase n=1 Tax=Desulfatirhabdium butyrativorans TaxID=340467 RepID=UPI000400B467|nr:protein phosphatase 2C domain-containing protein [Desulfatirhabdium butyrativorans]